MHLIGDAARVKDKVAAWEASGVTTLLLSCHSPEEVRQVADVILG